MKKIIAVTALALCLIPARGMSEQSPPPPEMGMVQLAPAGTGQQSSPVPLLPEEMVSDADLIRIAGRSGNEPIPLFANQLQKPDLVLSRIKLWDEARTLKIAPAYREQP